MKLTIIKAAPWTIKDRTVTFRVGQMVEVGKDVPDSVGQEMLEHGYAEPSFRKDTLVTETKAVDEVPTAPEPETEKTEAPKRRRKRAPKE